MAGTLSTSGNWAPGRDFGAGAPPALTVAGYMAGILSGDRVVLARAITLIESTRPGDQALARELVNLALPHTGKSVRVGITGSPGSGKSALIEVLGGTLTASGHRVAVLTVDPSSERSGGSLLGDKTRMTKLSADPGAFIRPSPSGLVLGGIARETRETMLLCEAAGYGVILIETVGVGQSEVSVSDMTDFLLVLMLAGAGDEVQGIKRGLLELADLVAVTKADGDNLTRAKLAASQYAFAMHLLAEPDQGMAPVVTCSAVDGTGVAEIWTIIADRVAGRERSGHQKQRRSEQSAKWMWSLVDEQVHDILRRKPSVEAQAQNAAKLVRDGTLSPMIAADRIIAALFAADPVPVPAAA
jgi:LAO/AO transport system kinase